LPIALPSGKPNTKPAIERAVALLSLNRTKGMEFIRRAYRAFWCEGRDISERKVLVDLAGDSMEEVSNDSSRRIAQGWGKPPGARPDKLAYRCSSRLMAIFLSVVCQ